MDTLDITFFSVLILDSIFIIYDIHKRNKAEDKEFEKMQEELELLRKEREKGYNKDKA